MTRRRAGARAQQDSEAAGWLWLGVAAAYAAFYAYAQAGGHLHQLPADLAHARETAARILALLRL